jgi:replicative DNA helicase
MRLSAPIFRLKRKAKLLSRDTKIALNQALDRVARDEGFESWSLLSARLTAAAPARRIMEQLQEGDLLLLGSRPGHGKTLMALGLMVEAVRLGRHGAFFTLEYTKSETLAQIRSLGTNPDQLGDRLSILASDDISADVVIQFLAGTPRGTVAVIDYLQILDQKRSKPELSVQVADLSRFARETGRIIAFIAQIDRSYDPMIKPVPDIADIRLPNPIDLALFSKTCFMHDGQIRLQTTA